MELRVVRHGLVDSTSELAFAELAAGRARDGDVHVATGQTAGRGRRGRTWHSAEGEGLYLSVVLRPPAPAWSSPTLTMALGLAALDAVRALGLADARLDWPNDVVVGGAKLCGTLVETRDLDPARPAYVAGIGCNVRQRAFPRALTDERAVTSLALEGVDCSVEAALDAVLRALPHRLDEARDHPEVVERDYVRAAGLAGRVRVLVAGGTCTGELEELSARGGVVVRAPDGARRFALEHVRGLEPA